MLDPDDAREATASGADGIVVSNHGGRQLDGVSVDCASAAARSPKRSAGGSPFWPTAGSVRGSTWCGCLRSAPISCCWDAPGPMRSPRAGRSRRCTCAAADRRRDAGRDGADRAARRSARSEAARSTFRRHPASKVCRHETIVRRRQASSARRTGSPAPTSSRASEAPSAARSPQRPRRSSRC